MAGRPARQVRHRLPQRLQALFFSAAGAAEATRRKKVQAVHRDPNVFLIDDFLSSAEVDYFDALITENDKCFSKSYTEDGRKRIVSQERTSTFFHLVKCQDKTVRAIEQRAADFVGLHVQNVEPLQVVRYTGDQMFDLHHDSGTLLETGEISPVDPMRYVTFFVYLNSLPTGLGSTEFPSLGVQVHPRRGSAVLFCNVLPNCLPDARTVHRALPVSEQGLWKYGLNVWISVDSQQDYAHMRCAVKAKKRPKPTDADAPVIPSAPPSALCHAEEGTRLFLQRRGGCDDYWQEEPPRVSACVRANSVEGSLESGLAKDLAEGATATPEGPVVGDKRGREEPGAAEDGDP